MVFHRIIATLHIILTLLFLLFAIITPTASEYDYVMTNANPGEYDSPENSESQSQLSQNDIEQLQKIYGKVAVQQHFSSPQESGESEHIIVQRSNDDEYDTEISGGDSGDSSSSSFASSSSTPSTKDDVDDNAKMNAVNSQEISDNKIDGEKDSGGNSSSQNKSKLDPVVVRDLLQDILHRIDSLASEETDKTSAKENATRSKPESNCNLHGLWLSSIAGVAIELLPTAKEGRIEIKTKIMELPKGFPKGILTTEWTGHGMISPESPTTITIVFQEHNNQSKSQKNNQDNKVKKENSQDNSEKDVPLPKTAVFVGQCLLCESTPILQGTWVVFPNTQNCLKGKGNSGKENPKTEII